MSAAEVLPQRLLPGEPSSEKLPKLDPIIIKRELVIASGRSLLLVV